MKPAERAEGIVRRIAGTDEFRAALRADITAAIANALQAQQASINNLRAGLVSWRDRAHQAEDDCQALAMAVAKYGAWSDHEQSSGDCLDTASRDEISECLASGDYLVSDAFAALDAALPVARKYAEGKK